METYEFMNRLLMPLDEVLGIGLDALKKTQVYAPLRDEIMKKFREVKREDFVRRHQLQVLGEDNLPEGGCLIACNHASWLDVQVLGAGTRRPLTFVAKDDFRSWPFLRRMIDLSGGIYVKRGGDDAALGTIAAAVEAGRAVVLFPEGTIPGEEDIPRWDAEPDTGLLRGRTGIVRVALQTGRPIVPCGLSGTGRAFPPEAYPRFQIFPPLPQPFPITLRYGEPLTIAQPPGGEITKEFLREQTHRVMLAITALIDHTRDYVPITLPLQRKEAPASVPRMAWSRSPKGPPATLHEAPHGGAAGAPHDGRRAPLGVLVLPGFTSNLRSVEALVRPLDVAELPYRVPILAGRATERDAAHALTPRDRYEDAENALLDLHRECERVLVVGFSMGGLCALELAARHRDKVGGVCTLAAPLTLAEPLGGLLPLLARLVAKGAGENYIESIIFNLKSHGRRSRLTPAAVASLRKFACETRNLLSFIKAPVLILQSKDDPLVAPAAATRIADKVSSKDKAIIWFEHIGHDLLLDPEAPRVVDEVMAFVRKVRASVP